MASTYHKHPNYWNRPAVRALLATNVLFAAAILVSWQWAIIFVLDPMTWAASQPVPHGHEWIHLLEYPLIVFWALPSLAVAVGWVLIQGRHYRAAFGLLSLPILISALTLVMYVTLPTGRP